MGSAARMAKEQTSHGEDLKQKSMLVHSSEIQKTIFVPVFLLSGLILHTLRFFVRTHPVVNLIDFSVSSVQNLQVLLQEGTVNSHG